MEIITEQANLENEGDNSLVSPESVSEPQKEKSPLFQAIGTLYGLPERDESGKFFINLGGQHYRLFILSDRYRAWLKQYETQPSQPMYLRVYPKYLSIPQQDPIVSFQVTAWEDKPLEEESGLFRFKGVWQFVPQVRIPVISIYRNQGVNDPKGKFKATHLPILMRREDGVNPFKFNPKVPKEELPKRYFIQAIFKFIPSRNCFGWVEDLEPPTEKIPKYEKPVKTIPTANQQTVKETGTQKAISKEISPKRVIEVKKEKANSRKLGESKPIMKPKLKKVEQLFVE
jgi:hypothetical protein